MISLPPLTVPSPSYLSTVTLSISGRFGHAVTRQSGCELGEPSQSGPSDGHAVSVSTSRASRATLRFVPDWAEGSQTKRPSVPLPLPILLRGRSHTFDCRALKNLLP